MTITRSCDDIAVHCTRTLSG